MYQLILYVLCVKSSQVVFIVISAIFSDTVHSETRRRSSRVMVLHITLHQHRTAYSARVQKVQTLQKQCDTFSAMGSAKRS